MEIETLIVGAAIVAVCATIIVGITLYGEMVFKDDDE